MRKKIKIISPSTSFEIAPGFNFEESKKFFNSHEFEIELGNDWLSNQHDIKLKVEAIHHTFLDKSVDIIMCSFGGFHAINLIDKLDYNLIKENPKPFFGFSDITVLLNAIYSKTGLITYYGPLFLSFLAEFQREFTLNYFNKSINGLADYQLLTSNTIIDYDDNNQSSSRRNEYWIINKGSGKGILVGGHIPTFNLLQGTEYFPDLNGNILLLEMNELDGTNSLSHFKRLIKSLQLQPGFNHLEGILVGAFHSNCEVTFEKLKLAFEEILTEVDIPVIANCNFGHILPIVSLPIGGVVEIKALEEIQVKVVRGIGNYPIK